MSLREMRTDYRLDKLGSGRAEEKKLGRWGHRHALHKAPNTLPHRGGTGLSYKHDRVAYGSEPVRQKMGLSALAASLASLKAYKE